MTNLSMRRCDIEDLKEENKLLRQLLKECKSSVLFENYVVKETSGRHSKDYKMLLDLLTRINAAIGESNK